MVNLESHRNDTSTEISASVTIETDYLVFKYRIIGQMDSILLPLCEKGKFRRYDLWDHTCFECFIKDPYEDWYIEFNFAPSKAWNCFYISSYRCNEGEYMAVEEVIIEQKLKSEEYELVAKVHLSQMDVFNFKEKHNFQVGLTAVIENVKGELGYWCLLRRDGEPDFHDPDTFIDYYLVKE